LYQFIRHFFYRHHHRQALANQNNIWKICANFIFPNIREIEINIISNSFLGLMRWKILIKTLEQSVLWKIDYFDSELKHFVDPLSDECKRIVTVMLAKEY